MNQDIKFRVSDAVRDELDSTLLLRGFARSQRSLIYTRVREGARHRIDLCLQRSPRERPHAAAALYPLMRVSIGTIGKVLDEMVPTPVPGVPVGIPRFTLVQPADFTAPQGEVGRWFLFADERIEPTIRGIRQFFCRWTLPFLDRYCTAADVCAAYERGEPRNSGIEYILRVVAAMILCGRYSDARDVATKWLCAPDWRNGYTWVFDFIDRKERNAQSSAMPPSPKRAEGTSGA